MHAGAHALSAISAHHATTHRSVSQRGRGEERGRCGDSHQLAIHCRLLSIIGMAKAHQFQLVFMTQATTWNRSPSGSGASEVVRPGPWK